MSRTDALAIQIEAALTHLWHAVKAEHPGLTTINIDACQFTYDGAKFYTSWTGHGAGGACVTNAPTLAAMLGQLAPQMEKYATNPAATLRAQAAQLLAEADKLEAIK
jgi:hypothetical protein